MGTVLDTGTPDVARVYDFLCGGKESFPADRDLADRLAGLYPEGSPGPRELAAANRAWLEITVRDAVRAGIGQVLDLGAGFPAPRPLHEVARDVDERARVVYVDRDPVVASHGQAAVEGIDGVTYAAGDLGCPGVVMAAPEVRAAIDLSRPVVAVFGLVLGGRSAVSAGRVVASWADWLPAGSRIAVTVPHWPDAALWERVREVWPAPLHDHSPAQVRGWFRGMDLLGSCGIEVARGWGPGIVGATGPGCVLAGVARKP